ncbi:hypothetical protein LguiA_032382 [Lonicera macranthoides]
MSQSGIDLTQAPYDLTPLDTDGHGTHTASTAAGIRVKGASLYGLGRGTARGGVSSARLAVYKVCWGIGCSDMDLLAGFDAAISDGVDIISVSIGGASRSFFMDPMAIGAFHALKKGILTVCAAGNERPNLFSVQNVAPWLMTIAATSTDRKFETLVKLGNEKNTSGISLNTFSPKKKMYPLTSGALAANLTQNSYGNASACEYGTLSEKKVKGKIVFCLGMGGQDDSIKEAPKAVIYKSKSVKTTAPFIASFSARGPQLISQNILKPDLAAPGLNILAAYSKFVSITGVTGDNRYENFNIISGTSMACPHAAAAAAYVKTFRPKWSPAAIKSALMTTEAADIVFTCGANIVVVGINITTQVQLTDHDLDELRKSGRKHAQFLSDMIKFYRDSHVKSDGVYGIFLHDPVSFVALVRTDLFTYKVGVVRVETQGICLGHTLMDQCLKRWNSDNPWSGCSPISVAWTVDVKEALMLVLSCCESIEGEFAVSASFKGPKKACDEIYVVQEGETLQTISEKCGDPCIVEENPHIHDPDDVFPGLVIKITPFMNRNRGGGPVVCPSPELPGNRGSSLTGCRMQLPFPPSL